MRPRPGDPAVGWCCSLPGPKRPWWKILRQRRGGSVQAWQKAPLRLILADCTAPRCMRLLSFSHSSRLSDVAIAIAASCTIDAQRGSLVPRRVEKGGFSTLCAVGALSTDRAVARYRPRHPSAASKTSACRARGRRTFMPRRRPRIRRPRMASRGARPEQRRRMLSDGDIHHRGRRSLDASRTMAPWQVRPSRTLHYPWRYGLSAATVDRRRVCNGHARSAAYGRRSRCRNRSSGRPGRDAGEFHRVHYRHSSIPREISIRVR